MKNSERNILKKLRDEAQEAASLFSNAGQEMQERTAVAGFLHVLGIDFQDTEILKKGPEPVDVWFRQARFQVTEILDKGRPRNSEIKERFDRLRGANGLEGLIDEGTVSSLPITASELGAFVLSRCEQKAQRYAGACSHVDLLIYVNLENRHLFPREPIPELAGSEYTCWRSVSIIMERFAMVLRASDDAPSFLLEHVGQACLWEEIDSVFPKLGAGQ